METQVKFYAVTVSVNFLNINKTHEAETLKPVPFFEVISKQHKCKYFGYQTKSEYFTVFSCLNSIVVPSNYKCAKLNFSVNRIPAYIRHSAK